MYFREKYEPNIINPLTNERIVQDWCNKYHAFIRINDLSSYWAGFSNMYGQLNGLSVIEAGSFSYMISLAMTGLGVSCSTDMYFREDNIEYRMLKIYDDLKEEFDDEEDVAKELFFAMFELYLYDIEDYTYKTNSLSFRLSQSMYDKFMDVDGETKTEKLGNLLRRWNE